MKWVELTCGHRCWVPWLEAFPGREVMCPGPGERNTSGNWLCMRTPQQVVFEIAREWPVSERGAA